MAEPTATIVPARASLSDEAAGRGHDDPMASGETFHRRRRYAVPAPPPPRPSPSPFGRGMTNRPVPIAPPPGVGDDRGARLAFLEAMPVAALLVDRVADIRHLNEAAARLVGLDPHDLLGRNVLDFVGVDHLDVVVGMIEERSDDPGTVSGPSRLRYVDADGASHWTQIWAHTAPTNLGEPGVVLTLVPESVRDVLASAVSSVGADISLDASLALVAEAVGALPIEGRGAILAGDRNAGAGARLRAIGMWPIDESFIHADDTPWRRAFVTSTRGDVDDVATATLTPGLRAALRDAGVGAVVARPIHGNGLGDSVNGVFTVFRSGPGALTRSQEQHLTDAIRMAGLFFGFARRQLQLAEAVHSDPLTHVANRAAFNERLRVERRALDVLYVDLDGFKRINDAHGHAVGDAVLREAAVRIESTIRRDDRVYRTGGDEFMVLCEATGDDPSERIALAERIVALLLSPFPVGDERVQIGATLGIAAASDRSLLDTVRAADAALQRAKLRGRAGWVHDGD